MLACMTMIDAMPSFRAALLAEIESSDTGLAREDLIAKTAALLDQCLASLVDEGRLVIEPCPSAQSHQDVFRVLASSSAISIK